MRDIVYKKAGESRPVSVKHTHELPPQEASSSFFENIAHQGNLFLGNLSARLNPEQRQEIVAEAHFETPKKHTRTRSAKPKRAPIEVKKHFKTPHAKLAIANAIILAGTLGYMSHIVRGEAQQNPSDASAIAEVGNLRQYLPQTRTLKKVEAFNETTISEADPRAIPIYTWVTPWNAEALAEASSLSTSLSAFWLTVNAGGADFTPKSDWSRWNAVRTSVGSSKQLYLTVTGDPDDTFIALTDPDIQQAHISKLLTIVTEQGFHGVDIDYEALGSENREYFTTFIRALTTTFHGHEKKVAVTLESRLANQVPMDWRAIGNLADEVRIMVYDYHGKSTGFPGPIAPLGWIKEVVDFAVTEIPSEKLVVGLGNYGYDWAQSGDGWEGTGQSFEQATSKAKEVNAPLISASGIDERGYDIGITPSFSYRDAEDVQHVVWFEDRESLQTKVNLVKQYPIRGIIFWSVGLGDSTFWAQHSNKEGI